MSKPLPTDFPAPSSDPGFYLFTIVYSPKLNGARPPPPKRERYPTLEEAKRAQERFRYQYREAPGAISTIVPAVHVRTGKR